MEAQLEKIREVQREAWNKSSPGWKKWDQMVMDFFKPMGTEIINMLHVKDADYILDVATGTGEPGLTIASMLKQGKVTGTDLSEGMLAVASENASRRGINNFETVCCDVSALPFKDDSFDAISCRLGFMFFSDMQLALKEMLRVLKPGGHIAASVWNIAEKNSWINTSMSTMISLLQLTPPAPPAPGLFRCAQQGYMNNLFLEAGFKNLNEKEISGQLSFDSPETYWSFITEVACPLAFSKADASLQQQIKEVIFDKVKQKYSNGNIALESSAIVISGKK